MLMSSSFLKACDEFFSGKPKNLLLLVNEKLGLCTPRAWRFAFQLVSFTGKKNQSDVKNELYQFLANVRLVVIFFVIFRQFGSDCGIRLCVDATCSAMRS